MRERLHTLVCMILVLAIFTGCKGAGAILKVAFVAAYVGLRVAAAAASSTHSSSSSSESSSPPPESTECKCAPVEHGETWCQRVEGEYGCVLECDSGWIYRDGICVAREVY